MRIAIAEAHKSSAEGGVAIGAVIIHEVSGRLIATGRSLVQVKHDPTSHAEVNCIRQATSIVNSPDLYEYTLYSTLEPCHMCLSAAAWAKIPRIYFGAYRKDVDSTLFDVRNGPGDEAEANKMNLREHRHMRAVGGVLEAECASLLKGYHAKYRHTR